MNTAKTIAFIVMSLMNIPLLGQGIKYRKEKLSEKANRFLIFAVLGMVFSLGIGVYFCVIQDGAALAMSVITVCISIWIKRALTGEILNTNKQQNEKEQ